MLIFMIENCFFTAHTVTMETAFLLSNHCHPLLEQIEHRPYPHLALKKKK